MKIRLVLVLLVFVLVLTAVGCGSPATPEPTLAPTVHPGKALVSSKCIGCHDLNRVENAKHDREGWELTVNRMVLSGAQLNESQAELVTDYLALTYPGE